MRALGNGVQNYYGALTIGAAVGDTGLTVNAASGFNAAILNGALTTGQSFGLNVSAGTNSSDYSLYVGNTTATQYLKIYGDGGVVIGSPTGADGGGFGSLNIQNGLYIAGNAVYAGVPQNNQTTNYLLTITDANKHIRQATAGTVVTIPANVSVPFPIGTVVTFLNASGGNISIGISSDTLVLSGGSSSTGTRTLATNSIATAIKTSSTVWFISGSGLT